MTPKRDAAINTDDIIDIALHDEIKWRAYELYERQDDNTEHHDLKTELQFELLRVHTRPPNFRSTVMAR